MTIDQTALGPSAAPEHTEPVVDWHRLDVRMLIVRAVREIRSVLSLLVGLVVFGAGSTWYLVFSGAMVGLMMLGGVMSWYATRYRITAEQVELHTGLINRRRLSVPRDRVRTVDLGARFTHRLLRLSVVRVGTGQHGDDLTLDAVSSAEAERLRLLLLSPRVTRTLEAPLAETCTTESVKVEPVTATGVQLAALDRRWLRFAPLTLAGLVRLGVFYGLVTHFQDEPDIELVAAVIKWFEALPLGLAVTMIVVGVPALSVAASVRSYISRYWRYRLTREPDRTIRVQRGLFTTRSVSIAEDRLRGAEVVEPLLLRVAGAASVSAVTTGLTDGGGDLLLPPAPVGEAHRVCGAVLGVEPEPSPTAVPLRRHPAAALRRQVVGAIRPVLAVAAVLVLAASDWTWPWPLDWTVPLPFDWTWPLMLDRTWPVVLGLVPCAVLLGWDRYRSLGHALTDRHLVARTGSRTRITVALQRSGIIGWNLSQTYFQRRAGMVTLSAITAAGDGIYHVIDIAESDSLALADRAVPGLLRPFLESDAVDNEPQHQ